MRSDQPHRLGPSPALRTRRIGSSGWCLRWRLWPSRFCSASWFTSCTWAPGWRWGQFGFNFITDSIWDPVAEKFGAFPLIFGTLLSSFLALLIAVPLSLGVAVYITEFAPKFLRQPVAFVIELLAAIPSVVYGLWGIFVLIPFLKKFIFPALRAVFGFLPFFQGPIYGPSMLAASIILAIMIMPFIMSVAREVLLAVPDSQREASLALGATRWEAVISAIIPMPAPASSARSSSAWDGHWEDHGGHDADRKPA